jgi:hypothetical protein
MSELYNTTVHVLDGKGNVSAPADHYVVGTVRECVQAVLASRFLTRDVTWC